MKNKIQCFIWFLITCFASISYSQEPLLSDEEQNWLKNQDSISVALLPYYPPYQFTDTNGNMSGVFIDLLDLMEEKMNYKFKRVVYKEWVELYKDAKDKKVDLILEIQQTKEREIFFSFYSRLSESNFVIVTQTDKNYGNNLKDYYDKKVTIPKNYAIQEFLMKNEKGLPIYTEINDLTCMLKVSEGVYDAFIGPRPVVNYYIKTQNIKNLKIAGKSGYDYISSIAVQKDNKTLNDIIRKVTNSISDKEKEEIFDNWLFSIFTPFYRKANFWMGLVIAVFSIALSIFLLNRYLKYLIKQKTKELVIARDLAEESNRLKTAFIHNISHEVRTPMNGILGFSKLLSEKGVTATKQKEYSKIIIESSNQLIQIIDNIIEISQLQTNQVRTNLQETDFNELIQTLNQEFVDRADRKKLNFLIQNKVKNDQSLILIDKIKLYKILYNLIDNAIKFTPENGSIEISCISEGDSLKIAIKDTGIGIKQEDQEMIFVDFSQSKKEVTKSYDGLGLGLSIAQKNAKLIQGNISFTSRPEEGSIFLLTIPYQPIIHLKKKKSTITDTTLNVRDPITQVILIAEDGEINYIFLKTLLHKIDSYKFVVHRAKNGKEALDICEVNPDIDLVLMDIQMPILDGYNATRRIKKKRPDLPVIAQTAYSTENDINKALESGCDDFLSKPIDPKKLKKTLEKFFI